MASVERFKPAPPLRPALNIGAGLDVPTGRWFKGEHGEYILSGGLHHVTGLGGRGNSFKSTIAWYMLLTALHRYTSSSIVYDTEQTATMERFFDLSRSISPDLIDELEDVERFILTDKTIMSGNVFYDNLREELKERTKKLAKNTLTLPMVHRKTGELLKVLHPYIFAIDSLSQFSTDSMIKYENEEIGEGSRNIEAMREAMAKTQLLRQLSEEAPRYGGYGILTAHVGERYAVDTNAPPQKTLSFLSQKIKFKNVPEKIELLTNNLWMVIRADLMVNKGTKGPEYPFNPKEVVKGNTDLMCCTVVNLRGKGGAAGFQMPVIVSQKHGVLASLSEFHLVKTNGRFGLGGNDQNYHYDLLPDVSLSRTTVRSKLETIPALKRVATITAEMLQMRQHQPELGWDRLCTPLELYDDLIKKGYDWDILLNTRGYWIFKEQETKDTLPFLSTLDLLNMRMGTYHPWWYDKLAKKKEKTAEAGKKSA